ncbi:MAG: type II CRISPR RNA-guided endonuclease Cas9 [Paludibacteraceae bacterium]|nr:type II CRISPR RNA-guided endonuclease Cas9 [Paludibacteraceae bacterium]
MKKILGLDLGTNSIGWAVVNEAQTAEEKSSIVKLGVRVNPLTVDELTNFEKGKSITTNADRTLKRSARRNLQRYKLRREQLIKLLVSNHIIDSETILSENGNRTTFETYRLRAKAATEEISLVEFARVLLMINKKRGYKSSRKAKSTDEGQLIDGMEIAKKLYDENLTPGQYTYQILKSGKNYVPDFYRSDLQNELNRVWIFQKQFYENELSEELKESIVGRNKSQTWAILAKPFSINGIKRNVKGFELKLENYKWRNDALSAKLGLEELAIVLQEINGQISNSSGYLGAISDRSKTLFFNKQTVGQYQMAELNKNPHYSFKNQVFYRQDYLDEFETIWETQSKFHAELTPQLKHEIRNVVIFYQRPLKSQKGLISLCEFEHKQIEVEIDGKKKVKTIGLRVCPKSSPLFQEFKIWQILNNLEVSDKDKNKRFLESDEKQILFKELQYKDKLSKADALKLLYRNYKELDLNYSTIDGNRTQATLTKAYQDIILQSGNGEYDFSKMSANQVEKIIVDVFNAIGINTDILKFDSCLEGVDFEMQPMYQLWHLLYSYEGDNSNTGNAKLFEILKAKFGFDNEYANILANVAFQPDYGSLSTKAMRKILPYMRDGLEYSVACEYAGYRHSQKSLTKEELENKVLKDKLDLLPRNSLRNPVVEKILNQMVNVVNGIIGMYGKPDEIRIELARELKKSAKERVEMTKQVNATSKLHEEYKQILTSEFGISNPTRNDIIRYKLYLELKDNGFKTLYTGTYIPQEKLFSKEFDIEHIIPQSKAFDDSFGNKTLEARQANIEKGNMTAYDYVASKGEQILADYKTNIERLRKINAISATKAKNLLTVEKDIPNGFINRDLRESQYIAKKAKEMLEDIVKCVVPTTGTITDRLREDWQLVDVMKELNWDKYSKLGLTHYEVKDGRNIPKIDNWTKRNDHRHHAMDALTIAFTKRSIIQYLNNLNARKPNDFQEYLPIGNDEYEKNILELSDLAKAQRSSVMYAIEQKELYRYGGKLRFISPIPLDEFRSEAKKAFGKYSCVHQSEK